MPAPINGALNLYTGLTIEPKAGDCRLILNHIREVWCSGNEQLLTYVISWLARMMQMPDQAAETALVLKSGQGAGKNIIVDILTSAFGSHAFTATKPQDILGQFNEHIATSVLIFMNEALWGGDKSSEGALKGLITDDFVFCERKYMPKFRINNCSHLIIATNNDWYAPIDMDDRRYVVLDLSESKQGDTSYFTKLKHEIDNGGSAVFIRYLLEYDIRGFRHRVLPTVQGKSKLDNQLATGGSAIKWWFECLSEGSVTRTEYMGTKGGNQILNNALRWDKGEVKLQTTAELHASYAEWCNKHGIKFLSDSGSLVTRLTKLCPSIKTGTGRPRAKILPVLDTARAEFSKATSAFIEWDD